MTAFWRRHPVPELHMFEVEPTWLTAHYVWITSRNQFQPVQSDAHFCSGTNGLGIYWLLCISCLEPSRINIMLPNLGFYVYEGQSGGPIVSLYATLHIIPLWLSSYLLKFGTSWYPARRTGTCLLYSFSPRTLTSRRLHLPVLSAMADAGCLADEENWVAYTGDR